MVDYTQPKYRDDTWKNWHQEQVKRGGKRTSEALQQQYTNKRVWARLALQNPLAPTDAKPQGASRSSLKRSLFGQFLGSKLGRAIDARSLATTGHRLWEKTASPGGTPITPASPATLARAGAPGGGMRGSGNR